MRLEKTYFGDPNRPVEPDLVKMPDWPFWRSKMAIWDCFGRKYLISHFGDPNWPFETFLAENTWLAILETQIGHLRLFCLIGNISQQVRNVTQHSGKITAIWKSFTAFQLRNAPYFSTLSRPLIFWNKPIRNRRSCQFSSFGRFISRIRKMFQSSPWQSIRKANCHSFFFSSYSVWCWPRTCPRRECLLRTI